MIAFLRGQPVSTGADCVILDVTGIGYRVFVPTPVIAALAGQNSEVTLHTYLHVREDAMQLYGFLQEEDLGVFASLIQVSGIGPKVALAVLSSMTASSFIQAVLHEQVDILTRVPGVGKKTGQRAIIELKDKFAKMNPGREMALPGISTGSPGGVDDALQALIALGYSPVEARRALGKISPAENGPLKLEDIVKMALKELGRF